MMAQSNGHPSGVASTAQRRAAPATAAQELDPATGQRFREMCHDIRQPVAGVVSLATAALAEPALPGAARSRLEQIVCQAESLAELLEESLGRSYRAAARTADLARLAREAAAAERAIYPGTLTIADAGGPLLVDGDRVDIRRIIANLLSNATRAAGPDGQVTMELSSGGGCARLVLTDSGPGFGQIASLTGLGTGVIARCLVHCGGRITYRKAPGGGVSAVVSLPLAPAGRRRTRCG